MPFDDFTEITRSQEARTRAELIHAFNHSSAGLETGRMEVAFVGEASRTETAEAKRKKAAARFLRDIQEIMREGEMGGYVAEKVFGVKTDAEITDIVEKIKAKTGLTLEDYAAGIIGADDALRKPGESEADYNRRILGAAAVEIVDPATGQIKPEYADDPLAQIIMADEAYRSIMADVASINADGPDADALVTKFADAGYDSSELAGHKVEVDPHKSQLRNGQDEHSDAAGQSPLSNERNAGFFDLPGR